MKALKFRTILAALAGCGLALTSTYALTPIEAEDIRFIRQEEKLARDVYDGLYAVWGQKIFTNIAKSERNHIAAMEKLMASYGIADTTPAQAGKFSIPVLQDLYDDLMEKGNKSLVDALLVGVFIEEIDIADLNRSIEATNQEDIIAMYTNLRKGSVNHLDAFTRQIPPLYRPLEAPTLEVNFDSGGHPVLSWTPENPDASAVRVSRQAYGTDSWETVSELSGLAVSMTDLAAGVETTTYRVTVVSSFEEIESNPFSVLRPFPTFAAWADAANLPDNIKMPADDAIS